MPEPRSLAQFLIETPLYKKWRKPNLPLECTELERPALNLHCDNPACRTVRTFNMVNEWNADAPQRHRVQDLILRALYTCGACATLHMFVIELGPAETRELKVPVTSHLEPQRTHLFDILTWVRKVGQHPPWFPRVDSELRRALGPGLELYKHALAAEAESIGIGACANYRRMIEDLIMSLAEEKRASLEGEALVAFDAAWTDARRDGSTKIELVKDQLPSELRIDGLNPLRDLYSSYSEAIHSKTPEEATSVATDKRDLLLEVFKQIHRSRESRKAAERVQAMLKPKAAPTLSAPAATPEALKGD